MIKKFLALIACIAILPNCDYNKQLSKKRIVLSQPPKEPTSITVFIHGSVPPDFFKRMPPFRNFYYFPLGLTKIKDIDTQYTVSNFQELYLTDPQQFNPETLYLFGWSGKMSFKARSESSEALYKALITLQAQYPGLPITLITHSHGGNVALNLACISEEHPGNTLVIDRLILCACPVQSATQAFVRSPLFKNIYVFYSPVDFFQVIDPQGLHRTMVESESTKPSPFSQRRFPEDPKLFHIRLRINGWRMKHSGYLYKPFLRSLPAILHDLATPESRAKLDKAKGCKCDDFMIKLRT